MYVRSRTARSYQHGSGGISKAKIELGFYRKPFLYLKTYRFNCDATVDLLPQMYAHRIKTHSGCIVNPQATSQIGKEKSLSNIALSNIAPHFNQSDTRAAEKCSAFLRH